MFPTMKGVPYCMRRGGILAPTPYAECFSRPVRSAATIGGQTWLVYPVVVVRDYYRRERHCGLGMLLDVAHEEGPWTC